MRNFDTYNPEIEDIPQEPEEVNLTYGEDEPLPRSRVYEEETEPVRPKRKQPRKTEPKPKPKAEKPRNQKTTTNKSEREDMGFFESLAAIGHSVAAFFNSAGMRLFLGSFFGLTGIWLLVCFISYVGSGFNDASAIAPSVPLGQSEAVTNSGGELGARVSNYLINDCFGLGAAIIILWLLGMCLKLFHLIRFKGVNFFMKCLVALITTSLIIGLFTISMNTSFNWGGNHGRYINEALLRLTGWYGALLVCILMIIAFVSICLNDLRVWIMKKKAIYQERKRKEEEEREALEERRRQVEALQGIEEQEQEQNDAEEIPMEPDPELSFDGGELPGELTYRDNNDEVVDANQSDNLSVEQVEEDSENDPMDIQEDSEPKDPDAKPAEAVALNTEKNAEPESKPDALDVMKVNVNNIEDVVKGEKRPDVYDPTAELSHYKFPPYQLLRDAKTRITVDQEEQMQNKDRIRKTLLNFDIPIVGIEATVGPTVTLYEIIPDKGVRIAKIRNLVDDIALSLAAIGVRIIAPIPGKGTVGIEVANKDPQTVSMRTVIRSRKYQESKYELPIALGSTISGEVYIADLAKMPHLLVAGATGQGKSVGLNAIIASLLYRKHPAELKFVLIDPKMVEFSLYSVLENHYLAKLPDEEEPIITDPRKVVATLSSLCVEMDSRYALLKEANVRNIKEYNAKFIDKRLNPEKGHRFLPYIVVIVDEFSDLIMTAGKEVEMPIARIAQKARAVGMHMIIATQRPSTNVITGVIKANFPARMAFKVSSGVDSKTILDTTGAQQLIGRGDMLLSNNSEMERVQCAFIDTPEVEAICKHISKQPSFGHAYILPEPLLDNEGGAADSGGAGGNGGNFGARDPLFEEVARLIVNSNTASTSSLQRRYSIGYNRAGKIMDQLEAAGIVGPAQGGKARPVLVDPITLESML